MISQKKVKNNAVYNVLKAAWENYGSLKMSDLEEEVMGFDFENVKENGNWTCLHGQYTDTT